MSVENLAQNGHWKSENSIITPLALESPKMLAPSRDCGSEGIGTDCAVGLAALDPTKFQIIVVAATNIAILVIRSKAALALVRTDESGIAAFPGADTARSSSSSADTLKAVQSRAR